MHTVGIIKHWRKKTSLNLSCVFENILSIWFSRFFSIHPHKDWLHRFCSESEMIFPNLSLTSRSENSQRSWQYQNKRWNDRSCFLLPGYLSLFSCHSYAYIPPTCLCCWAFLGRLQCCFLKEESLFRSMMQYLQIHISEYQKVLRCHSSFIHYNAYCMSFLDHMHIFFIMYSLRSAGALDAVNQLQIRVDSCILWDN